jgi:hypothetical protein
MEFIKNKYGARSKAMVRHISLIDAELRDDDVIVVYREKTEDTLWVGIHRKWGLEVIDQRVQVNMPISGLMSMIEKGFKKAAKRRQIPRVENHIFRDDETI